ncbi:hypothetical protein VII_003797 [Vibrio mimicus MB451]|nr:hypothetical protein VII_003797 [Vibrio mimicus MB451]
MPCLPRGLIDTFFTSHFAFVTESHGFISLARWPERLY